MTRHQILALFGAAAMAVTLIACGGGGAGGGESGAAQGGAGSGTTGSGGTAPRPESPFASAAMFVPAGAASKSFALSECEVDDNSPPRTPVTSATVVIQANGDMVFSGAVGTATVAELARINFADAYERNISNNTVFDNVNSEIDYFTANGRQMTLSSSESGRFISTSPTLSYYCDTGVTTATLVLEQPLSQARVVSNIVTGSTGTVDIRASVGSYTKTGSIVSWDSGTTTATFSRFISFNLDTAQLGQGSSPSPDTHKPVSFVLPGVGSTINGFYSETLSSDGNKTITFNYDNINMEYSRYAKPVDNGGFDRQFRFTPP